MMQVDRWWKDPVMQKTSGAILLIVLSLSYMAYRSFSKPSSAANLAYFTTDDGSTLFADSADKVSPFDHDGKPAFHATVYSLDGGKTKKVAYLDRLTPDGKVHLQDRIIQFKLGKSIMPPIPLPGETEVKLPGANNAWVSGADISQAQQVKSANMPSDPNTDCEIVLP